MRTEKPAKKVPRNAIVVGMLTTHRPTKFRHRADRRPKDARRDETRAGW